MGASAVLLMASHSWAAQCTMDTECAGEEVCENGQCVEPAATPPVAAAPPVVAMPPAAPEPAPLPQPTMVRHSPVMMAAGIVMMPLAIGALFVAASNAGHAGSCDGSPSSQSCDNEGVKDAALYTAVGLVAVGIPLIIIGAKKEPAKPNATASFTPWATPTCVGVRLRISL